MFESLGYNVETHGQKTYNGVAIALEAAAGGRAPAACPATTPTSTPATSRPS